MDNILNDIIQNKKVLIGLAIFFIFIILINIFSGTNTKENLQSYLKKQGYLSESESNIYYKKISSASLEEYTKQKAKKTTTNYEMNYFDTTTYEFKKNKREYEDNMETNLNMTYNFKEDKINYNYRLVLDNNGSMVFSGTFKYQKKDFKFTCINDYSYNFNATDDDELVCDNIEVDVLNFYTEALNSVKNSKLLKEILKSKKN